MSVSFSSDQVNVTYTCSLDGAAGEACASPKQYSGISNGSHTFTVAATSSAGLTDSTPAHYTWSVDTTPPNVTITNSASLPSLTNSGSISIEFASNEASTFECVIDGGSAVACSSPVQYAGLPEGAHAVAIFGIDSVGNRSVTPASFQWTIDQTAPMTRLVQVTTPDTITNSTSKNFDFSANEPSSFECSVDQGGFGPCTSPMDLDSLNGGGHSFEVRATDLAGITGMVASFL